MVNSDWANYTRRFVQNARRLIVCLGIHNLRYAQAKLSSTGDFALRRLSIGLMIPIVTLTSLMVLIRWGGGTRTIPLVEVIGPDPTCAQPCWHGIQVGRTTIDEAQTILQSDTSLIKKLERPYPQDENLAWNLASPSLLAASATHLYGRFGHEVQAIRFNLPFRGAFRLGDAIAIWGEPVGAWVYYCSGADADHVIVDVYFKGNFQVRTVELFNNWRGKPIPSDIRITPDLPLVMLRYYSDSNDMIWQRFPAWNGFKQWHEDELGHTSMCDI